MSCNVVCVLRKRSVNPRRMPISVRKLRTPHYQFLTFEAVLRGIADEFHKTCEGMELQPKISECRLSR